MRANNAFMKKEHPFDNVKYKGISAIYNICLLQYFLLYGY